MDNPIRILLPRAACAYCEAQKERGQLTSEEKLGGNCPANSEFHSDFSAQKCSQMLRVSCDQTTGT